MRKMRHFTHKKSIKTAQDLSLHQLPANASAIDFNFKRNDVFDCIHRIDYFHLLGNVDLKKTFILRRMFKLQ